MFLLRARVYWLTWGLLVAGAWSTGMASVEDAFFRGAVAAFLAAWAVPLFARLGPRKAAFAGLLLGVLWQLALHHAWVRLTWSPEGFARSGERLGIDVSVAGAAFAGAALTAALGAGGAGIRRQLAIGATLALGMTSLPYGVVRWIDATRAGPVEVLWVGPAERLDDEGLPVRRRGLEVTRLDARERAAVVGRLLVVDAGESGAVAGPEGRLLWPVWRQRLAHPGHESLPARRLIVVDRRPDRGDLAPVRLALSGPADGAVVAELDGAEPVARGDSPDPERVQAEVAITDGRVSVRLIRTLPDGDTYFPAPGDRVEGRPTAVPAPRP
jgi:hypothetical protein